MSEPQRKGFPLLLLSRRIGETITITVPPGEGGTMTICVADIIRWKHSGVPQARLGIEAPRAWHILRPEAKERQAKGRVMA